MNDQRSITGRTFLTVTDHLLALFWSSPRLYCLTAVGALVALILALMPMGSREVSIWSFGVFAALFAITFVGPAMLAFNHWRLGNSQKKLTYLVDADNIATRDATGALIAVPWSVVRRCVESKSGFVFALRPAGIRWFVKRAFKAEDVDALRQLIKSKLGEAAKLRAQE